MSQISQRQHGRAQGRLGTLLVACLLAACGGTTDQGVGPADPARPSPEGPAAAPPRAPAVPAAPVLNTVVPPRSVQVVEKPSASVEACIEQNIHAPDYDGMNPRDSRRKLRRLQVKADCEQQHVAAR